MNVNPVLEVGVLLAFIYAVIALAFTVATTFAVGRRRMMSVPNGSESSGIKYAFTQGMMPSAKESVQKHMPTFVGGLLYHAGIASATLYLLLDIGAVQVYPAAVLGLRLVMLAGLVAGVALLVKRVRYPKMRIISTPDDFIANILVDLYLAMGIGATMAPALTPVLLGSTIVLLLYVPLGKIRHCVFFFLTRLTFGRLFGRRGVFPQSSQQGQAGSQ
jgi:nitrate reductase gamma subunit